MLKMIQADIESHTRYGQRIYIHDVSDRRAEIDGCLEQLINGFRLLALEGNQQHFDGRYQGEKIFGTIYQ